METEDPTTEKYLFQEELKVIVIRFGSESPGRSDSERKRPSAVYSIDRPEEKNSAVATQTIERRGRRIYTTSRTGISYTTTCDENTESFQSYARSISKHCQQYDLGYLLVTHFMTTYLWHGINVFSESTTVSCPGLDVSPVSPG
jgi:hypothetical protein